MTRASLLTAAFVAAVFIFTLATLPPARLRLDRPWDDGTIAGVVHIHTNRSDGRSSPEDVARAAARAGLKFIVFTDHGDATRQPDAPVYRDGVLCLDGVEISTTGGHYVALGLPQAPYPLGGEPRAVVEDVARLGGFGVAAHPDSPKLELRWEDWTAPFDGMEIINPDSGWRARVAEAGWRPKLRLIERLLSYPIRPGETLASLVEDPRENIERWDQLVRERKVVGLAGADAHSKLALRSSEPGDNRFSIPLPSYEASFETLSVHVRPETPLSGVAASDADAVLRGIRQGHVYLAVDGLATPPVFSFAAERGGQIVGQGDEMPAGSPATLRVRSNAPAAFATTVWSGAHVIASTHEHELTVTVPPDPAVYRVEIRTSDQAGARGWIFSNPIYLRGGKTPPAAPAIAPAVSNLPIFDGQNAHDWVVEHDATSTGITDHAPAGESGPLGLRYTLGVPGGAAAHPYVALSRDLTYGVYGNLRLAFTAHAAGPMRLSVQLRTGAPEERWQRSVYLDATPRETVVDFGTLTPAGDTRTALPALDKVRAVLFVVDSTHTKPGTSGQLWFDGISLQK